MTENRSVTVIPARQRMGGGKKKEEKPKLRVAAYCRVSTDSDEQATSYETQIEHYTSFIQKNPEWELAGIFADDGISGTNTKKREEFNRMIDECMAGKIDMIITKSISRFARNTLDCLKYIRELKSKNIPVFFEKENINTMDSKGEVLLTIMASLAQIYIEGTDKNLLLIGMNSMKIDSPEKPGLGYFSKEQLRIVANIISEYKKNESAKTQIFVAFHHHLLPVAVVERDTLDNAHKYSITLDARRALNSFLENKVEFAVHGHQHQPSMVTWKDDERKDDNVVHVIAAGCLAGKKYAGEGARNSFMLYSVSGKDVVVYKAQTADNDSEEYEWDKVRYLDAYEKIDQEELTPVKRAVQINKKRIITLAEQDDRWIAQVDAMSPLTIKGLVEKLVDSIDQEGAVAYEVDTKRRYRTSTLATVLECMYDIRLLPEEDLLIMQRKLLRLKDEFVPLEDADDVIDKGEEDKPAWGIDEAPSVWTTSKALTALFSTQYEPTPEEEKGIAASVEWLANQAYADGGWGYQKYDTIEACKSSVPMTSFAMKALGLALQQSYIQNLIDVKQVKSKLVAGLDYLKKTKSEKKNEKCVWSYGGKENLSATIWAIEAWKIAVQVIDNKKEYYSKIYSKIAPIALKYVVEKLPEKDEDSWSECFFRANKEDGLKYKKGPLKKDKAFYSFTPYIISYIIKENESYVENDKILKVMKWVLAHRDDSWLIKENYNSDNACTITVAMAINVIVNWLKVRSNSLLEQDLEVILS